MNITYAIEIISILCVFAGTSALAGSVLTKLVGMEWMYKGDNHQPITGLYYYLGFLFYIRNYHDASKQFMTIGNYNEIKKRIDAVAPIRGVIWIFVGSVFQIALIFL